MMVVLSLLVIGILLLNRPIADRFSLVLLDRLRVDVGRLPVSLRAVAVFAVVLAALISVSWIMVEIVPKFTGDE